MNDGMDEIIDDFVTEAEEALDRIDPMFVELEERGYDRELLNEIFRSVHTIKGAAGFLGFQPIVEVSHRAENLLKRLRDEEMTITPEIASGILKGIDMVKVLLGHIKAKDGKEEETGSVIEELDNLKIYSAGEAAPPEPPPAPEHPVAGERSEARETLPAAEPPAREPAVEEPPPAPERAGDGERAETKEAPSAGPRGATRTLRVDVDRIDNVMNLTGEIVLVRNRLLNIGNSLEAKYPGDMHVEGLQETVSFLDLVTSDIQLAVMKMRMQVIKRVFSKFPRLVRDISQNLGKEVRLSVSGEDTEVDRSIIERIADPMVHIIRNAIDHGIEPPQERRRKGKPSAGIVDISASHQGSQIIIEVSDDGRGVDIDLVKRKAVSKGLLKEDEAHRMPDKEAANLIFLPGFSTVDTDTEMSGRGVGMDVVKTNISKLNGYVEISTTKGLGSTIRMSIPLTLAIIQALMVRAGGTQYAIPLSPIEETLKVRAREISKVTGSRVLAIRDKVHSLVELKEMLGYGAPEDYKEHRYVLLIAIGDRRFCVAVDELMGQEEVVIKAIEGIDTETTGILGATITGEGKVVLILDPSSMAKLAGSVSVA